MFDRFLTLSPLSRRRPISYRNQSIDLQSKSMDWFLFDIGLRRERVKYTSAEAATGGVLQKRCSSKLCAKFTEKHLWQSLFLNKETLSQVFSERLFYRTPLGDYFLVLEQENVEYKDVTFQPTLRSEVIYSNRIHLNHTFFNNNKLYKNNEAETNKKIDQIKNILRLGSSKTKKKS